MLLVSCRAASSPEMVEVDETETRVNTSDVATTVSFRPSSTTFVCETSNGTEDLREDFPDRLSSVVGVAFLVDSEPCVERVVIEFETNGAGTFTRPGWWVRYASGPVYLGMSGQTIDLLGDATLLISVGAWMPSMEGVGYSGPTEIEPMKGSKILEIRQVDNWEGQNTWAIGLSSEQPFSARLEENPTRLVVEISI